MCWGVRNMARFQLLGVKSPNVEIEVGGEIMQTSVIKNVTQNPNFDDPILFFDIVRGIHFGYCFLTIDRFYLTVCSCQVRMLFQALCWSCSSISS